jgi:hypothetical protein
VRAGCLAIVALLTADCASIVRPAEIARDRAIEIARGQVRWAPFESAAVKTQASGRTVWRVTLKGRLPGQPPELFETAVVDIDAASGAVVRIAKT